MKALILYDNGVTTSIAHAMYDELKEQKIDVSIKLVDQAGTEDLAATDILIVGSPTKLWKASPKLERFFSKYGNFDFSSKNAAAFCVQENHFLAGSASQHIVRFLKALRFHMIADPQSFFSENNKITDKEVRRARAFAKYLWMY